MRKNIKSITLSFAIIAALSSCDNSDDGEFSYAEGNAYTNILTRTISLFDTDTPIQLESFTEPGTSLSEVEVLKGGEMLTEVVATGNKNSFSSAALLPFSFSNSDDNTGTVSLELISRISNGESGKNNANIVVSKAISLDKEVSNIIFKDTVKSNLISYSTFTAGAIIDEVSASWKKGKNGDYAPVSMTFGIESGSIDLAERAYESEYNLIVGDTLYYQFTASSGTLFDTVETSLVIKTQPIGTSITRTLSNDSLSASFNLDSKTSLEANNKLAEIQFVAPNGFEKASTSVPLRITQFNPPSDMTPSEYFDANDLLQLEVDFNDNITDNTGSFATTSKDDIFIYEIMRPILDKNGEPTTEMQPNYGVLKIDEITNTNNGELVNISFSYRENSIIK